MTTQERIERAGDAIYQAYCDRHARWIEPYEGCPVCEAEEAAAQRQEGARILSIGMGVIGFGLVALALAARLLGLR